MSIFRLRRHRYYFYLLLSRHEHGFRPERTNKQNKNFPMQPTLVDLNAFLRVKTNKIFIRFILRCYMT